jgi:hypothetical protein
VRAVAEVAIKELKDRLAERAASAEAAERSYAADKSAWAERHRADRAEIARLTEALFKHNDDSIASIKVRAGAFVRKSGENRTLCQGQTWSPGSL